jgi:hypothetical protein
MLLKIPATGTLQGALKFVALIIKILSCNKKKKIMVYDQNYHNCSTLVNTVKFCKTFWQPQTFMPFHNGGNDRFSARLGILTILTIGFFVIGNQNYDSIGPQKWVFRIYHYAT